MQSAGKAPTSACHGPWVPSKDCPRIVFFAFVNVKIQAEDMSLAKLFWEQYKQILCDKGACITLHH